MAIKTIVDLPITVFQPIMGTDTRYLAMIEGFHWQFWDETPMAAHERAKKFAQVEYEKATTAKQRAEHEAIRSGKKRAPQKRGRPPKEDVAGEPAA